MSKFNPFKWRHRVFYSEKFLQHNHNEQLALALRSITEIAKSSPFKDLANLASVRAALDDPNHEWKFWDSTV